MYSVLASSLKCLETYILPTAAEKLPAADPTQDFQRGVVSVLPVIFLAYSSITDLADLSKKPMEALVALQSMKLATFRLGSLAKISVKF